MSTKPKKKTEAASSPKKAKKSTKAKKASSTKSKQNEQDLKAAEEKAKEIVLNARKRTSTPALFKAKKTGKHAPVVFTMEDVKEILETRKKNEEEAEKEAKPAPTKSVAKKTKVIIDEEIPVEHKNHQAASLTDILGFNPNEQSAPVNPNEQKIPKKFSKYYKALLDLREHVSAEISLHTADTLKRSSKEDSGDLSGYGQHMADAGTDTSDRDFALSLVSSEQEALYEIEEAIQRIFDGSYGNCEITGEPIDKERLEAVPFTRYSLDGQRQLEKNKRNKVRRTGGVFADSQEDGASFREDVDDN